MEFSTYVILFALLMFVIWIENRKHKRIGNIGEKVVRSKLDVLSDEYVVLHNVHYSNTQIDHMVICHDRKLVFVIETKMWGGIITGNYNDKKWIQNKNGVVSYYDNPILQNKYHCNIVRQKYYGYSVRSIVVFVGNKNIPPYKYVINEDELVDYIIKTTSKVSNRIIIDSETDWLSMRLKPR